MHTTTGTREYGTTKAPNIKWAVLFLLLCSTRNKCSQVQRWNWSSRAKQMRDKEWRRRRRGKTHNDRVVLVFLVFMLLMPETSIYSYSWMVNNTHETEDRWRVRWNWMRRKQVFVSCFHSIAVLRHRSCGACAVAVAVAIAAIGVAFVCSDYFICARSFRSILCFCIHTHTHSHTEWRSSLRSLFLSHYTSSSWLLFHHL